MSEPAPNPSALGASAPSWRERFLRRAVLALLLAAAWGAIYLPALGIPEWKGEEARRAMPGLQMLQDGEWLVPKIGGRAYHRKPPLINWIAAGAVHVTGRADEWAIRLPSALGVLALTLAAFFALLRPLGEMRAVAAAVFILTNIGLMEQGRKFEIEALYVTFTGLALLAWLRGWWGGREGDAGWLAWLIAGLFLGLGLLLKGPLHLLFFYGAVVPVLLAAGQLRALLRPAHFVGLLLALGLFASWAVPMLRTGQTGVSGVWLEQFTDRVTGATHAFDFLRWLRNLTFQAWVNFVPWVILAALAARPAIGAGLSGSTQALWRGLRWAIALPYLCVMILPAASPRYVLPLLVPGAILAAFVLPDQGALTLVWRRLVRGLEIILILAFVAGLAWMLPGENAAALAPELKTGVWVGSLLAGALLLLCFEVLRRAQRFEAGTDLVLRSAAVMGLVALIYGTVVPPRLASAERLRPLARALEAAVPRTDYLYAFDPDSQPAFFYLRRKPRYVLTPEALPETARYVFVGESDLPRLTAGARWQVVRECHRYIDRGGLTFLLVELARR
ncbi:MAG: glycosyltransferase family 39 protein [Verrucomicrobia bacterium]|nr:glycosyltransferase family 39 protein [Verrucomicrobiota bacterium]